MLVVQSWVGALLELHGRVRTVRQGLSYQRNYDTPVDAQSTIYSMSPKRSMVLCSPVDLLIYMWDCLCIFQAVWYAWAEVSKVPHRNRYIPRLTLRKIHLPVLDIPNCVFRLLTWLGKSPIAKKLTNVHSHNSARLSRATVFTKIVSSWSLRKLGK